MEERPSPADAAADVETLSHKPFGRHASAYSLLRPAQEPDELGRLGGFRLLRLLGRGGMGMVFEADDPALSRRVAVKVMRPEAACNEVAHKRFLRESRAAAAVCHDHVVPIYQVGEDGSVPFLVMPLLRGESLEARLKGRPRLPAAEVLRIGREAALGLAAAHAAGLIHRDVKPHNLWMEETEAAPGGRVRVLDFGLARLTEYDEQLTDTNTLLGTAAYMAPEQARAETVDGRADLFSLGCILYRMATGKMPFDGASLAAVLTQIATYDPPPPHTVESSTPLELSDLIMRLLSKDPAGRPPSAREVADALSAIKSPPSGDPTVDVPDSSPPPEAAMETKSYVRDLTVASPQPKARSFRLMTCSVTIAVACFMLLAVVVWQGLAFFQQPDAQVRPVAPPPTPASWHGAIDVVIHDPVRGDLNLLDPDVVPLRPGDQFAVEAELDRPVYCYVLWIDADGTVDPVYPWKPGHWDDRPAEEEPVRRLRRPAGLDAFYSIKPSSPGMETLVLLVRDTPLPRDKDLKAELGQIPPQTAQTLRATVWFENGQVVRGEAGRASNWDEQRIDDPLRATQEQIRSRLGALFPYTRTVSFADRGK